MNLIFQHDRFYEFNGRWWEPHPEFWLAQKIRKGMETRSKSTEDDDDDAPSAAVIRDLVEREKQRVWLPDSFSPPCWLPSGRVADVLVVANGIVNLEPLHNGDPVRLDPHTPKLFAIGGGDYAYDAAAICDGWDSWFQWFQPTAAVRSLLLQFTAYCLLGSLQLQKWLLLQGRGANGKSVFFNVLQMLFGHGQVQAIPFERLGDRFGLAEMRNKIVNISADAAESSKVKEAWIKMLTDGSLIPLERKFVQHVETARLRCRQVVSANHSLAFRDRSDAIWRRLIEVTCEAKISDVADAPVPNIEATFRPDLPGILNQVLAAAADLVRNQQFTIPHECTAAVYRHREDVDPTLWWLRNCLVFGDDYYESSEKMWFCYTEWMKNRGYGALSSRPFWMRFNDYFSASIQRREIYKSKTPGIRQNCWRGLSISEIEPDGRETVDELVTDAPPKDHKKQTALSFQRDTEDRLHAGTTPESRTAAAAWHDKLEEEEKK